MNIIRLNTRRGSPGFSIIGLVAAVALICNAAAQTHPANHAKPKHTASQAAAPQMSQSPGERKFQENCSRCHTTPEQLSPRIAGTIVMHMRVRASLSAQDAQDIMRYLFP